jgi:hypothetical protein
MRRGVGVLAGGALLGWAIGCGSDGMPGSSSPSTGGSGGATESDASAGGPGVGGGIIEGGSSAGGSHSDGMAEAAGGGGVGGVADANSGGAGGASDTGAVDAAAGANVGGSGGALDGGESDGAGGAISEPANCIDPRMIDDMEDGDLRLCIVDGREATWFSVGISAAQGRDVADIPGGRGSSSKALHLSLSGLMSFASGVGTDLKWGTWYNAGAYRGIAFWAKTTTGTALTLAVHTADTIEIRYGGTCPNNGPDCEKGYVAPALALSSEWKRYDALFADMTRFGGASALPLDTTRLMGVQLLCPDDCDVWIDDISFVLK